MSKSLAECLEEAANLIESSGWARGHFERVLQGEVHYCMAGAIREVCPERWPMFGGELVKAETAGHLGFEHMNDLYVWNDGQKDKRPVIRKLRKGAKEAKVKGL
jgi:hypothetical protein